MAYSYNEFTSKSQGDTIEVTFPFLRREHVFVVVAGVDVSSALYSWANDGLLTCLSGFPAGDGRVERRTPVTSNQATQVGTSVFDFEAVNQNDRQLLYAQQEAADGEAARQAVIDGLEDSIVEVGQLLTSTQEAASTAVAAAEAAGETQGEVETLRAEVSGLRDQAGASATAAQLAAESTGLPTPLQAGDEGKMTVVKADRSGYELRPHPLAGGLVVGTFAAAAALTLAVLPEWIETAGYYSAIDMGGARYQKVASEPTHEGKFQLGGQWYSITGTKVSVRQFGAKGDGANNDRPAIAAAAFYAQNAVAHGTMYIPATAPGLFYNLLTTGGGTRSIMITKAMNVEGEGARSLLFAGAGYGADPIFNIDGTVNPNLEYLVFEKFRLRSLDGTAGGFINNRAAQCHWRDISFHDIRYGINNQGNRNFSNTYAKLIFQGNTIGNCVTFAANFAGGGQHTFIDCSFNGDYGIRADTTSHVQAMTWVGCNFEHCRLGAVLITGDADGLVFTGCRAEKGLGSAALQFAPGAGKRQAGIKIDGGFWETDGQLYMVLVGGAGQVFGLHVSGVVSEGFTTALVRYQGQVYGGAIEGNFINATPALTSNEAGNANAIRKAGNYNSGGTMNT